jgi:predicted alpha/beta-hydrolase family hydrolase
VGLVFGHDIGPNRGDEFLAALQTALSQRGYLALRFNFPFVERGKKRPDSAQILERTFRAATAYLLRDPQTAPARIFLGGLGLGCRVASQMVAQGYVADGLVCMSYPLHPSGKPNQQRAEYLFRITCPMLFLQGSRDPYCRVDRLEVLLRRIGAPTYLHVIEDADHGLEPIKRSTRNPEELKQEALSSIESFLRKAIGGF